MLSVHLHQTDADRESAGVEPFGPLNCFAHGSGLAGQFDDAVVEPEIGRCFVRIVDRDGKGIVGRFDLGYCSQCRQGRVWQTLLREIPEFHCGKRLAADSAAKLSNDKTASIARMRMRASY